MSDPNRRERPNTSQPKRSCKRIGGGKASRTRRFHEVGLAEEEGFEHSCLPWSKRDHEVFRKGTSITGPRKS
jgi:hypothetical protein